MLRNREIKMFTPDEIISMIMKNHTSMEHEYAIYLYSNPSHGIDFDYFKTICVPKALSSIDTRGPQEVFKAGIIRDDPHGHDLGHLYIPPHLTGRPRKLYIRVLLVAECTVLDEKIEQERRDYFVRVSGLVHCNQCGLPLYDHPHDPIQPDLTIACSRERVKL